MFFILAFFLRAPEHVEPSPMHKRVHASKPDPRGAMPIVTTVILFRLNVERLDVTRQISLHHFPCVNSTSTLCVVDRHIERRISYRQRHLLEQATLRRLNQHCFLNGWVCFAFSFASANSFCFSANSERCCTPCSQASHAKSALIRKQRALHSNSLAGSVLCSNQSFCSVASSSRGCQSCQGCQSATQAWVESKSLEGEGNQWHQSSEDNHPWGKNHMAIHSMKFINC